MMRPAIFVLLLCLVAGGLAAFVQDETPTDRPNRGGEQRMQQGPPGPPSSMVVCKDKIFIFAGTTLYKVDPDSMKVVGELQVLKPQQKPGEGGDRENRDK